jgi:site-specific DNA-adenine methylase
MERDVMKHEWDFWYFEPRYYAASRREYATEYETARK